MKKINKKIIIITIYFICLVFTGCSKTQFFISNPNEIHFSDDFERIYETLLTSIYSKTNVELVSPKNGEHTLAINTITDNFNRTFAIIFYKNDVQQMKKQLRMAIFQKGKNNSWTPIANFPCPGYAIDKILFAKSKNSSNYFLVVGYYIRYTSSNSTEKIHKHFNVYNLDPHNCCLIKNNELYSYHDMELCDTDNSGYDKLVFISSINLLSSPDIEVKVLDFQKDNLNIVSNDRAVVLNQTNECKIQIDKKSLNQPTAFIDIKNNYHDVGFSTYVVTFNNNQPKQIYKSPTRKFSPHCLDFDNDGCLEIPTNRLFKGCSDNKTSSIFTISDSNDILKNTFGNYVYIYIDASSKALPQPVITDWIKISQSNDKIQTQVTATYTNLAHGYGFILPSNWENKVYAQYLNKNETIEFFEYNENSKSIGSKLLTLTCSNKPPPAELFEHQPYITLQTNGPFTFLAKIYDSCLLEDKSLAISASQLKNLFFLTNPT